MQSRLKIFSEFRKIFSCVCFLTDTDIRGDAADVNVGATLVVDELLQAGLAQLGVVKKCRVGVNIGIDSLVDDVFLWVFLPQILTRLKTSDISPP